MAEKLNLKVQCHACNGIIEGTAKYGKGQYSPVGVNFDFTATGKRVKSDGQVEISGETLVICPHCETRNKYNL